MNLLKCVLAGMMSVFAGLILILIVFMTVITASAPRGNEAVSIDIVSVGRAYYPHFLAISACLFALGFSWQYVRLGKTP